MCVTFTSYKSQGKFRSYHVIWVGDGSESQENRTLPPLSHTVGTGMSWKVATKGTQTYPELALKICSERKSSRR